MLGTQMHPLTFTIIVIQTLVLFGQFLFFIARPSDASRLRFLILIIIYVIYNSIQGLFPSTDLPISIWTQYFIAYSCGTALAFYFIYYIYKEFDIYPFQFELIGTKSYVYILGITFLLMFIIPYYTTGLIELSRLLYLSVLLFLSIAFLIWMGKTLQKLHKKRQKQSIFFRYRIIAGYLGLFSLALFPIMLLSSQSQWVKVVVLNFGFSVMMATYIADFMYQQRMETALLMSINKSTNHKPIHINDNVTESVLKALKSFEDDKSYLNKITLQTLAKQIGTNSKYLSMIINSHKGKNYTNYVNDLRIDYVKSRLENDNSFRHYTLQAMANEVGYTSVEGFINAFVRKEHIKPLEYLKQNIKGS